MTIAIFILSTYLFFLSAAGVAGGVLSGDFSWAALVAGLVAAPIGAIATISLLQLTGGAS